MKGRYQEGMRRRVSQGGTAASRDTGRRQALRPAFQGASATRYVTIPETVDPTSVLGPVDSVLREIEKAYPHLVFIVRGNQIGIVSHEVGAEPDAQQAVRLIHELVDAAARKEPVGPDSVRRLLTARKRGDFVPGREAHSVSRGSARAVPQSTGAHPRSGEATDGRRGVSVAGRHPGVRESPEEVPGSGRPVRRRHAASANDVPMHSAREIREDPSHRAHLAEPRLDSDGSLPRAITFAQGVPIRPKTEGQERYVREIDRNIITFGIGPAGTGKTYLAVAKAVQAFELRRVRRIILTRPAVEAGENLGFLPGTLNDKIDPYLRPLYDALSDMLGAERMRREMDDGTIEVAPLAYMRGRTLNDAFVILDEAQNTTEQQMKMFLTRLGFNTKMVVTGDSTQVDLAVRRSGLATIHRILGDIEGISFVRLTSEDVVRHSLVGRIVEAYARYSEERAGRSGRTVKDGGPMRSGRSERREGERGGRNVR